MNLGLLSYLYFGFLSAVFLILRSRFFYSIQDKSRNQGFYFLVRPIHVTTIPIFPTALLKGSCVKNFIFFSQVFRYELLSLLLRTLFRWPILAIVYNLPVLMEFVVLPQLII